MHPIFQLFILAGSLALVVAIPFALGLLVVAMDYLFESVTKKLWKAK